MSNCKNSGGISFIVNKSEEVVLLSRTNLATIRNRLYLGNTDSGRLKPSASN